MSSQPLATPSDLAARIGRDLDQAEAARAPVLLADASALVRDYTRQDFSHTRGDAVRLRASAGVLRLSQRPVTAVTSVTEFSAGAGPQPAARGWVWDGKDKILLPASCAHQPSGLGVYDVVYDHGYPRVPAQVVAVVCAIAARTLLSPSLTAGMVAERIGNYNYQLQQGGGAPGATVVMSAADEKALARYGPRSATTITVGLG
ncbi:hypothetical protein [Streptomyces sp. N35]|uniref:hypothetical protein n=1 Tax=Streptomyces sp. N35 TaxID=2795730 RepID=UPI0018F6C0AA|nr:hypothetical protein [Streptomyces sp. N35]